MYQSIRTPARMRPVYPTGYPTRPATDANPTTRRQPVERRSIRTLLIGAAIATARKWCLPGTFELDIDELPGRSPVFTQKNGAAVTEHREAAELVSGIRLCNRLGTLRQILARE